MNVTLVGVGMGDPSGMTVAAREALTRADVVIGAPRLLATLPEAVSARRVEIEAAIPEQVARKIRSLRDARDVCVALSGDTGFYSGAKKLAELLRELKPATLPGISSPQYLAARLGRPWQDFRLVSGHGVQCDVLAETLNHPAVLFLTGGGIEPAGIVQELCDAGLGDARVTVGERLSSPEERIVSDVAVDMANRGPFASPAVVLVENSRTFARAEAAPGIDDQDFIRGDVPMTKREIRVQALALMRVRPDSVVWDVGAGTGSVAVEAALLARRGRVFTVERLPEAQTLIRENRLKFGAYNLTSVIGLAPKALDGLPRPDIVFVGGSGGNLREILETALAMNPDARLVVSAIALETLTGALDALDKLAVPDVGVVQVTAARAVRRGGLRMLEGANPVYLIYGGGRVEYGSV